MSARYGPAIGWHVWRELEPCERDTCRHCRYLQSSFYCTNFRLNQLLQKETDSEKKVGGILISRAIRACEGEYRAERMRGRWP